MKIESLRPYQKKVNLTVKALSKNEAREVTSKLDDSKHQVTEAVVGDDSGTVLLTLWDDDIVRVESGKTYDVVNGFTSLFKNSLRLNIGRYGELKEGSEEITEVNEANSLSIDVDSGPKPEASEPVAAAEATTEETTETAAEKTTVEAEPEAAPEEAPVEAEPKVEPEVAPEEAPEAAPEAEPAKEENVPGAAEPAPEEKKEGN